MFRNWDIQRLRSNTVLVLLSVEFKRDEYNDSEERRPKQAEQQAVRFWVDEQKKQNRNCHKGNGSSIRR